MADDKYKSKYILKIGVENNEKVQLYYASEDEGIITNNKIFF